MYWIHWGREIAGGGDDPTESFLSIVDFLAFDFPWF
jgi:hypothetical protein